MFGGAKPASVVVACIALACGVATSVAWGQRGPSGALDVRVEDADGRPLAEAAVYLEGGAAPRPVTGVEIAQSEKRFQPTMTVVPVGTPISFPNRDTVRHHVYSFSPAKTFEIKLYVGTPARPEVFDKPGTVVLGCNIHDHMAAWVRVVESNLYGMTSDAGTVRLSGVPAGTYRLRVWHRDLPAKAEPASLAVTVGNDTSSAVVRLATGRGA